MAQSPKPNLHRLDPVWGTYPPRSPETGAGTQRPLRGGGFTHRSCTTRRWNRRWHFGEARSSARRNCPSRSLRVDQWGWPPMPMTHRWARRRAPISSATYERDPALQPVPEPLMDFKGVSGGVRPIASRIGWCPSGAQ